MSIEIRHDYTQEEIKAIYFTPILDLIYRAATVHRSMENYNEVQVSSLLSIKTGGCSEDCSYCSQSSRYQTDLDVERLMSKEKVLEAAQAAKEKGSSRMCLGAAWRSVRDNRHFEEVLEMVSEIKSMGMEVCCTLGMLTEDQAQKLADAGLYAYNHNIDTSENFYDKVITTRTFDDRLTTIENVRKAGITVCCGGIIGLGETDEDRVSMLHTLATMEKHPESVPINALVPVKGTPLENQERVSVWDMIRMIATARIIMPKSVVRLSAGRLEMTVAEQALCFMAGANSVFSGDKLLTTPNPSFLDDKSMFELLGLKSREAYKEEVYEKE